MRARDVICMLINLLTCSFYKSDTVPCIKTSAYIQIAMLYDADRLVFKITPPPPPRNNFDCF